MSGFACKFASVFKISYCERATLVVDNVQVGIVLSQVIDRYETIEAEMLGDLYDGTLA